MKTFWIRDEKRNPVACVAMHNDSYAVAIRRSTDNFNKVIGRQWAEGRLQAFLRGRTSDGVMKAIRHGLIGTITPGEAAIPYEAEIAALERIQSEKMIPTLVRRGADRRIQWLRHHPLNPPGGHVRPEV